MVLEITPSLGGISLAPHTLLVLKLQGRWRDVGRRKAFTGKSSRAKGRGEVEGAHTSLLDIGVLSSSGRCCSRARTMQLAMMVASIIYSNGVER